MRLIDAHGSYTINASDNTDYSLRFSGGIISVADKWGHIVSEFDADDAPTIDTENLRPQWIPVTERLPDVNKTKSGYESITVIATDGKNVRPMKYERACVRAKSVRRWRWIWDRIYDGSPITHWMPLPEPPRDDA